jgi:hypothetical protein
MGKVSRAVAERDAAIHAARRLLLQVVLVERQGEFEEVAHAVGRELILLLLPVELEEACDLAHRVSAQSRCMDCGIPFCHGPTGCPVHNQIPDWNDLVFNAEYFCSCRSNSRKPVTLPIG